MTKSIGKAGKLAAIGLAVAAVMAMPLSASAHDHGDRGWHGGGWHGGYHDYDGGYYRHGGYWSGGRWIAGAIVTGAVAGLVSDALRPAPVYYEAPVVYGPPRTVIYEDAPVVRRRVVETRTVVYGDPYQTRYVREYGDDDDD
ncbi:hypothetical protein RHOFW510R12_11395 [Rhodanobacter sp. FW510-R12]|uniref:hypothetical protein n=2 Tax=Rhodanobacter TaxID=75309 RepID=UPI0007A9EA2C|nr:MULTISPECIES: hypothetical protein [unclassified Rhodanobacter]KZC25665.1 hypothetical protein RhoFW510T8_06330 [Rhodanobacter sp. FW510-T8]KZC32907.1 hypothetical protein RhoFW510R10_10260 [Rhodanobacter sp. FW510-R10]